MLTLQGTYLRDSRPSSLAWPGDCIEEVERDGRNVACCLDWRWLSSSARNALGDGTVLFVRGEVLEGGSLREKYLSS